MTIPKIAFAVAAALVFSAASYAEGQGSSSAKEGGAAKAVPPQPRIVEPYKKQGLPPRSADPSWGMYQEGVELFGKKRVGEALDTFKKAVEARSELFSRCASDVAAALDSKEAKKAKDSFSELVLLLAARDLIRQDYDVIRTRAGGSIVDEMMLLRETSPSAPLRGLIDASLLVVEERGMSRLGDSLKALEKEVILLGSYPEAEYWIGKAYLAEGELRLAELQFRRACDMAESLELPEERYEMLDALAGVYKTKGDLKSYETTLREIADASELFAAKDEYYRGSMERTLGERGFDKFMMLFRVEQAYPIRAYSELGDLYLGEGRTIATIYLAAAVDAILSRSINDMKIDEPDYAYVSLADMLSRILADKESTRFAAEMELWKDLELLGESLALSGYRETAREIWASMTAAGAPQPWKRRAEEAFARPASASRKPSP